MKSLEKNKQGILQECASKAIRVNHLPFFYHIHLNMPCNQKCIMCVPSGKHAHDVLPFDRFLEFFGQVRPYAEHLTLIGGEPLMYPWIQEVLQLLAQEPIAVSINTNATMLNQRVTSHLLELHELNLKCSIDAATRRTYFRIRGADVFDRVMKNLQEFSDLTEPYPAARMILVYVVMKENLDEVIRFIELASQLRPYRVEFHPVRHVTEWFTHNKTGWIFDGTEQSCESFPEKYNEIMQQAAERCKKEGLTYEVQLL